MKRALAVVAALGVIGVAPACSFMNHTVHANCKVTGKDVLQKVEGEKGKTHTTFERRLSTTCGVFEVDDNLVGGFNAYDTWTQLQEGHVYDIETGGYRAGILSMFPVVTKVTPK